MSWAESWQIAAWIVGGVAAGYVAVRLTWQLHGAWKIHRAGPRRLRANHHRIWTEPDAERSANLTFGPGGRSHLPVAPFEFIEEHLTGSQPCVSVRDARGRRWRVKWGHEAKPEAFAVRLAWACGYFAEVTHYLPHGRIDGVGVVGRARPCLAEDGRFSDARFELEDEAVRMLFGEHSWAWNDNPFLGTAQLTGLKIVVMLLSNWDTKDRRDVSRGSNTAIFETRVSRWSREAHYLITDWGGAMGKWGASLVSRGRWDVDGFEAQTPLFVSGVQDGLVTFGYQGQRTAEIARDLPLAHVRWFYEVANRLTEPALREGLLACGATSDEAGRFARALRGRIAQLAVAD